MIDIIILLFSAISFFGSLIYSKTQMPETFEWPRELAFASLFSGLTLLTSLLIGPALAAVL